MSMLTKSRRVFQYGGPSESSAAGPIETAAEFFADGTVVELVRDSGTAKYRLLISTGNNQRMEDEFEHKGQRYRAPDLSPNIARAISIPADWPSHESTVTLFDEAVATLLACGFPRDVSMASTYGVFASWFPTPAEPAVCLTITGSPAPAMLLQQILGCMVRRGLHTLDVTSAGFATLAKQLHPTLLLDWRHLSRNSRRLLSGSCRPYAYIVAGHSAVDFGMSKVLYMGDELDSEFTLDFALNVHLPGIGSGQRLLSQKALERSPRDFSHRSLDLGSVIWLPSVTPPSISRILIRGIESSREFWDAAFRMLPKSRLAFELYSKIAKLGFAKSNFGIPAM